MTTKKNMKIIIIFVICSLITSIEQKSNVVIVNNDTNNKTLSVATMSSKYEEIEQNDIYKSIYSRTGDLTGYGANCPACGGHLGCNGQDVSDGTIIYNDNDYGDVHIVASSKKLKCGSIVRFNLKNEEIVAIVLDRGVTGYDLDLLVESESYASKHIGRRKINYDILREGWNKRL